MNWLRLLAWKRLQHRRARLAARLQGWQAEALARPVPEPRTPVIRSPLLALDLETTGLDPRTDRIISIGWVAIDNGVLALDSAHCLQVHIGHDHPHGVGNSAAIHGLRDCDLEGGIDIGQALRMLIESLNGRIAVVHHAPLDRAFLGRALRRHAGLDWLWPVIDTLEWDRNRARARHDEAAIAATTLDSARARFGLDARQAHDALADAISCAELALSLARQSQSRLIDVCRI